MIWIGEHRASGKGVSRREFLRVGSLGLGGLTLPWLLTLRAAEAQKSYVRDKSVVLLFLHGGPSQFETWDPKPDAPAEIRSMLGVIPTRLPGVQFGSTFPKMAALADRLAVVRSFATGNVLHSDMALAGNKLGAVQGAIYARLAGSINPRSNIPNHVLLTPASVGYPEKEPQEGGPIHLMQTGALGTEFQPIKPLIASAAPFREKAPDKGGTPPAAEGLLGDMKLNVPLERFEDRRALLKQLDGLKRDLDYLGKMEALDRFQLQAAEVLLKGVADAFDLTKEPPHVVARYATDKYQDLRGQHLSVPQALGKQMLLARRLCEAGCGFVSVYSSYWDFHGTADVLPSIKEGFEVNGPALDHAVAAFLEDVRARGLEDRILLVITGEMGRTPKGQGKGGRDHWGNLTPLVLAGGGLKTGQVIGRSDRIGSEPATNRYGPSHLLATIMQTLFDTGEIRLRRDIPGALADVVSAGDPIPGLL
jgi:pimeloyl-ACP methyl ester carboxylesterase